MIRIAWYALAAMLALVATGVELDRQSRRDPALAVSVPRPFRSFAQERIVFDKLGSDDSATALDEAERLIRRRPIPAENLFLLAAANGAAGNAEAGVYALGLSAERGWRVRQVQLAMIGDALQRGEADNAAARLLALWSTGADDGVLEQATRAVLAAPDGPEAFGRILAKSRFSQNAVLRKSLRYTSPGNFARMVHAALLAGAGFDCPKIQSLAEILSREGLEREAGLLLDKACRTRG